MLEVYAYISALSDSCNYTAPFYNHSNLYIVSTLHMAQAPVFRAGVRGIFWQAAAASVAKGLELRSFEGLQCLELAYQTPGSSILHRCLSWQCRSDNSFSSRLAAAAACSQHFLLLISRGGRMWRTSLSGRKW